MIESSADHSQFCLTTPIKTFNSFHFKKKQKLCKHTTVQAKEFENTHGHEILI